MGRSSSQSVAGRWLHSRADVRNTLVSAQVVNTTCQQGPKATFTYTERACNLAPRVTCGTPSSCGPPLHPYQRIRKSSRESLLKSRRDISRRDCQLVYNQLNHPQGCRDVPANPIP